MAMATLSIEENDSVERGFQRLSSIFRPPALDTKKCHRCKGTVYHAEKIGPVHEVVYHKNCFKCAVCGQYLTIRNYCINQVDNEDREIYCQHHYPRVGAAKLTDSAVGIRGAVNAQENYRKMSRKLNSEVRKPGTIRIPKYDANAVAIRRILTSPKAAEYTAAVNNEANRGVSIGPDAMGIKQPIAAQKLQANAAKLPGDHGYQPRYTKRLVDAQKQLEVELRKEEDEMFKVFQMERENEKRKLTDEIRKEWEVKLKELTDMYEKDIEKKKKRLKDNEKKMMTIQFENQKKELEKSIHRKKEKKKESMTLRLKEKEQTMTSTLVTKQSKKMLELLAAKKEELKKDLEEELQAQPPSLEDPNKNVEVVKEIIETLEVLEQTKPTELPPPHPPSHRKSEFYTDPKVFDNLDQRVIEVAQNDQVTYTDLVHQLTDKLLTDLEKVRSIYRWVTVKDLNVMEFDEAIDADTPMGLLRGIKYGTETYHVLFMRLCSYAGLHCVEIKGHSKSVGYEPGMKIQPEMFQNTWNAVLIDGDWRLVQCNWGARHLVLNKDKRKDNNENADKKEDKLTENNSPRDKKDKTKDKIRYQYDEHYFLTDPDEFIQEFWPREEAWQLLEVPLKLEEFEALPFVRSVFFHYGMQFEKTMPAVLDTNERGGADIKIRIPEKWENDLVFYYQLRFSESDRKLEASYRGAALERFVFQTMVENVAMFSVHVPTTGEYFFEIFANKIDESNRVGEGVQSAKISPFRLKCACKFKIRCANLNGKMHPLPDCASGEWGPRKAIRHFGLIPLYNESSSDATSDTGSTSSSDSTDNPKAGIINAENSVDIKFKIPIPLQFVAKLRMNHVEKKAMDPFVYHQVKEDILTVTATLPQIGQFGLDIYAKPSSATDVSTLSHACKFLINATKVSNPVDLPKTANKMFARRGTFGPTSRFDELGLRTISHKDSKINLDENQHDCTIELEVPEHVEISFQLVREPDEDFREFCTMMQDEKNKRRMRIVINLGKHGNFMLSLFARDKKSSNDLTMTNVFNYFIAHKKKNKDINGMGDVGVVIQEKPKSSGILRKSIFGSGKKKSKDKL